MRQFFKFLFASMLGFVLGSILLIFILVGIISAAVNSFDDEKVTDVKSNSMLFLDFQKPIVDRASKNPLENINFNTFESDPSVGLNTILENLRKAKEDKNIKGIYMELSTINSGIATVEEVRNALLDFKKSGKTIISYSEVYTQKSYYLASVADKIYMNPQGAMELKGLAAEIMFYKGLLDKIEVETQVIRHGRFKSAVEPFILDKMSNDNRLQTRGFMQSIWNFMLNNIASSRKLNFDELNTLTNNFSIREPEDAIKYKLIDKLVYKDEVLEELKKLTGVTEKEDNPQLISLSKYSKGPSLEKKSLKDAQIAIIYASGEIESGEGASDKIGSETVSKAIREARLNDKIKGL